MSLQLSLFPDALTAAQALAQAVAGDLRTALHERARALLLVSGGRTPLPFFAALAAQDIAWNRIDVSLVDERAVAPDHPDSNALLVRQHLLVGPAAAARWLPLIDAAALDPWQMAQDAAVRANAEAALATPAAVVLGVGADGHTASLFADAPQWDAARTTPQRYVALQPGAAPHARVGLSLQALKGQQHCYVWSSGAAKLEALNRARTIAEDATQGRGEPARLFNAGPIALLIADSRAALHVFHAEY